MCAAKVLSLIKKCLSRDRQMEDCCCVQSSCSDGHVYRRSSPPADHWSYWQPVRCGESHTKHDLYGSPTCGVVSPERTARDITTMQINMPPSIAISEDGEEGYETSQRMLRKQRQVYDENTKVGCVQPPPNRTVSQGHSPPPYRSRSVGALSHSAAIARKTLCSNKKDAKITSSTTVASPAVRLSDNNFNCLDGPPVLHGEGHRWCDCPRGSADGRQTLTVIRATTTGPPRLARDSTGPPRLARDSTGQRAGGCEHYSATCGFGPPPPYTDTQCVPSDMRAGVQYNSSI